MVGNDQIAHGCGRWARYLWEAPELWKTIGDEVLFTKRIDHPVQAGVCLGVWIQTLGELREKLRVHKLDVKATAWLADFPVRNNEIILQKNAVHALDVDEDQHYIFSNQAALDAFYNKHPDDRRPKFFVISSDLQSIQVLDWVDSLLIAN